MILSLSVAFFRSSPQVSRYPDVTTAHCVATYGPEPETHYDRLFPLEPSLPWITQRLLVERLSSRFVADLTYWRDIAAKGGATFYNPGLASAVISS